MNYEQLKSAVDAVEEVYDRTDFRETIRMCDELIPELEAKGESSEWSLLRARIYFFKASACGRLDYLSEGIDLASRALPYAEAGGDRVLEARIYGTLGNMYHIQNLYTRAAECMTRAVHISEEIGYTLGMARNLSNLGSIYHQSGDLSKGLEYRTRALSVLESLNDEHSLAVTTMGIGSIYRSLGDYPKSHEYLDRAYLRLKQHPHLKFLEGYYHSDKAQTFFFEERFDESYAHHAQSLALAEERGVESDIGPQLTYVAATCIKTGRYDEAYQYYHRAFELLTEFGDEVTLADVHGGLGELYTTPEFGGYSAEKAEEHLLHSIEIMERFQIRRELYRYCRTLSDLYARAGRYDEALKYQSMFYAARDEVKSLEARKTAEILEQERQSAQRERELAVERAKAKTTEEVLYKVLPISVAQRLINNEPVSDFFECISILFADVVGFTPIAASMKADDTVRFLNFIFAEFDRIMERHGCQKIKTMGDGYMAVCGAPLPNEDHAQRMALAALDLMNDIVLPQEIRRTLPEGSTFHLRIGLHSGPAFAGIIGEKGFLYDVYSDAVNIAARMESHGEPGKIHCSEEFIQRLAQPSSQFKVSERGMLEIKGKGKMRTYYVERM